MKTIARVAVPGPKEVEALWLDRIRRWKQGGLTARKFGELERVPTHQLHGWSGRFRRAGIDVLEAGAVGVAVPFSIVPLPVSGAEVACIEIAVDGATVLVRAGFDADLLRQVVAALERRS